MVDGGRCMNKSEAISRLQKDIEDERYTINHLFKDAIFWYDDDDEQKWKLNIKKRKQIFKLKFKLLKIYDKFFNRLILLMGEDETDYWND